MYTAGTIGIMDSMTATGEHMNSKREIVIMLAEITLGPLLFIGLAVLIVQILLGLS